MKYLEIDDKLTFIHDITQYLDQADKKWSIYLNNYLQTKFILNKYTKKTIKRIIVKKESTKNKKNMLSNNLDISFSAEDDSGFSETKIGEDSGMSEV